MASDSTRRSVSFDDIPIAKPAAAKPNTSLSVLEEAKGLARSLGQGVLMGFGEELESIPYMLPGGETREEALRRIRGEMSQYRQERPLVSTGAEIVGGMATGVAGGARALAAGAGRRAAGAILGSAIGQGAISGAGAAEGDITDRLTGAAIGGTAGAALPYVGGKAVRLLTPAARQIGEAAQAGYDVTRRGMANLLEGTPMQRVGRMIEPTDITRIQRESTTLPGSVTGPTVATMEGGTEAARTAKTQATVAAEQGKLRAQQATAARRKAEEEARQMVGQVKQEESEALRAAKQQAGAIKAQGKSRSERLSEVAKTAEAEAKAIQRGATAELKQTATATREQAKIAAQTALDEARTEAAGAVATLRGTQPRGAAKVLQDTIRKRQLQEAKGHYAAVRAFGAPPEPDPGLYKEIANNGTLRSALDDAVEALKKESENLIPGEPTPLMRSVFVNAQEFPELTLEMMDQMRRKIVEQQMRKGPNVVGLSRSQKKEALDTINRLEERYLAGFGSDDAAQALQTARSQYREKFQILEAVQDGLNLGTVKAGKASGLLTQSRKELDEVTQRVADMTDDQRAAFQVGAREWFDRLVQEQPDNALAIAKKFSSEASQRRLALAYGDDAVDTLRQFAPDVIGKRQAAAAAKVREEGAQLAKQITGRAEAAVAPLQSRAERAAALAERAQAQKGTRAEQILGQRQAEASRRLTETQRTTGAQVSAARTQAAQAQEEAGQLAASLTQARVAAAQAKDIPFADLGRALGTSTQQQTFLQRLLPQMTEPQRAQAVEVLGSNVQRRLQDLARQGESPERILREINLLKQNDAVRALFGPQIDAFAASLFPTIGTRIPGSVRPALTGALSRAGSSFFGIGAQETPE
jgi:chromosome segregation protein